MYVSPPTLGWATANMLLPRYCRLYAAQLTAEIMKRFSTWGLDKTSVLEQTVATGVDGSGKTISRRKVWGEVAEFLEENKRRSDACHTEIAGLSKKDKETKRALKAEIRHHAETRARILALFMIAMGGLECVHLLHPILRS